MTQQGGGALRDLAPGWRTRANALTGLRALLIAPLALAIAQGRPVLATVLFWAAVATDFADGIVARRYGEITPLGGVLDHAVDAALCVFGLAAHASVGAVPWILPPLVAIAFAQYALDSQTHRGRSLVASQLGRWNGIAYYVLVAVPIVRDTLAWSWPGASLVWWLGLALALSTVASMLDRLRSRAT